MHSELEEARVWTDEVLHGTDGALRKGGSEMGQTVTFTGTKYNKPAPSQPRHTARTLPFKPVVSGSVGTH